LGGENDDEQRGTAKRGTDAKGESTLPETGLSLRELFETSALKCGKVQTTQVPCHSNRSAS
jgi:hypothetical protein